jgi:hypothetical protein
MSSLSELGEAALAYAAHNLCSVFPLQPRNKIPFPARDKQGRPMVCNEAGEGAELAATRDPALIREWWTRWPQANIGAALRFGSLFVLDIDPRSDGHHWLARTAGLEPIRTLTTVSGRGWPGAHYWFQRNSYLRDLAVKSAGPGADLKGLDKGYVVVPPSIHPDTGKPYEWHDFADPFDTDIASPPEWLVKAILENCEVRKTRGSFSDATEPHHFMRGRELLAIGWPIGEKRGPGKWLTACPNDAQHTDGRKRRVDSSTILVAPSHTGGRGRIYCSHGHCAHVR